MTGLDRRGWSGRFLVVLAGAVAALGFAPFHIWGLTLLSLSVLFIRLDIVSRWEHPGRSGFATGLLFGLGWFSASCFWIASAFFERGPEFVPLIPPLVGGLAILLSLFWGVAAAVTARLMRDASHWVGLSAFAGSFMIAEFARGHVLSGFPWNMAGYAFEPGGFISQFASIGSIYGLTLVAYVIAALIGWAFLSKHWKPGLAAVLGLAGLISFGAIRLSGTALETQPNVLLRIVDVPFRQSEKMDPATSSAVIDRFIATSLAPGLEDVTHLVWPEGAVNGLAIDDEILLRLMGRLLTEDDPTPPVWLMNSLRLEVSPDPKTGEPKRRYYNSSVAVVFDEDGNPAIATTNDKRKLVPFGEFIPGGEWVEDLGAKLVSTAIASISPAPEKRTVFFPGLPPISAQICYEVIFPGLTPRTSPQPQAILNQSNDAWFGATTGPDQHAAIARYRAIEEGLPLVRSAANGVTGVFDAYGRPHSAIRSSKRGDRPSHIDAVLPKPLSTWRNISAIMLACFLISVCLLLQCVILKRMV